MSTSLITWKTIQNLKPGFHENCLKRQLAKTKNQDLIASLGNGALLRHSGNNLEKACTLASKLLNLLPKERHRPIFSKLFNKIEEENLCGSSQKRVPLQSTYTKHIYY